MYKIPLVLNVSPSFGLDPFDQLRLFSELGFSGFFPVWEPGADLAPLAAEGKRLGLFIHSVHAPYRKARALWHGSPEEAEDALSELIACLEHCARTGAEIMIVHAFIGFKDHSPNERGLAYFERLVRRAEELGVKLAFENTEGTEYLDAVLDRFGSSSKVGFCWDSGHELCYSHGEDLLAKYGSHLLCTHLNDNAGAADFGGEITSRDDAHLLPFDGIADWKDICSRLDKVNYSGPMVFELKRSGRPTSRYTNLLYSDMTPEQYLTAAYVRCAKAAYGRISRY